VGHAAGIAQVTPDFFEFLAIKEKFTFTNFWSNWIRLTGE
jgi:hypothetical protein